MVRKIRQGLGLTRWSYARAFNELDVLRTLARSGEDLQTRLDAVQRLLLQRRADDMQPDSQAA